MSIERSAFYVNGRCNPVNTEKSEIPNLYPSGAKGVNKAKAFCAKCPTREPCLDYAIENNERFGVWGGESERERRRIKKQREATAQPPSA